MKKVWEIGLENADGNDLMDELERLETYITPLLTTPELVTIYGEIKQIERQLTINEDGSSMEQGQATSEDELRLEHLLEKEQVAGLDKGERYELQELLRGEQIT